MVSDQKTGPSDDELVVRGAAGDQEALRLLVERWEGPIFAFTARMIGSYETAQDITQDVFLRVCRNAHRYRPSGRFKGWLFRIAGNMVRSRIRRSRIVRWVRFDSTVHDSPSPEKTADETIEADERKQAVRAALLKLPPRQRQAVALRYFEGMTYQEVAEAMEASVSAVESLLYRAMDGLKQCSLLKEARE